MGTREGRSHQGKILIFVDAHCHIDLYPSYSEVIQDAALSTVHVLAVTTTPRSFSGNVERAKKSPFIRVGLGLHPQIVGTPHADMQLFEKLLPDAKFVGEVGLDASPRYYKTLPEQELIFSRIIRLAVGLGGRPFSVHGVRAFKRVLSIVSEQDQSRINRYALHWFSGTLADARAALQAKCYFSINEAMIASERGRELIAALPREFVLTETDGPFIKRNDAALLPSMVESVVEYLALEWKISPKDAAALIHKNFDRFTG